MSGTSTALEAFAPIFGQDLNGAGVTGVPTVIQTDGSTSLTAVWYNYFLDNSSGSDPELNYAGAPVVAGQFVGWTPIGAVQTATGYDVAWENTSANEYTVWSTDSNGNYTGNLIGAVSGTSTALEAFEPIFGQDLNGDGVIGLYATPGTTLQINSPMAGASASATIGTGATLELAAANSGSVTFASSTGTLILEAPSTFSGEIFNFTGNGKLSGSDQIDLTNIKFNSVKDSYANGVLTVTDGNGDTAKLELQWILHIGKFPVRERRQRRHHCLRSAGVDVLQPVHNRSPIQRNCERSIRIGNDWDRCDARTRCRRCRSRQRSQARKEQLILDGTSSAPRTSNCAVTVSGFGAQNVIDLPDIAFDAQTTLGYLSDSNSAGGTLSVADGMHSANIALLGNYMASSFAMASDGHGGTLVAAEASQPDQSLLSNPHHA